MPSATISLRGPSCISLSTTSLSHPTAPSIHSIGYCPSTNVAQNMKNIIRMNMGNPSSLLVAKESSTLVVLPPARFPGTYVSASAPAMKPYLAAATIDDISSSCSDSICPRNLSRISTIGLSAPARTCSRQSWRPQDDSPQQSRRNMRDQNPRLPGRQADDLSSAVFSPAGISSSMRWSPSSSLMAR